MPGWLSWLERTAHRVLSKCSDFFLGYREAAGSNPAPGTSRIFKINKVFKERLFTFFKMNNYFILNLIFLTVINIINFLLIN